MFNRGLQESPAAYAAYPVSCYALIALTEAAVRTGRSVRRRVSAVPLVERWRRDGYFRVHWGLVLSLLVNLCYAGLRIVCAVRSVSYTHLDVYKRQGHFGAPLHKQGAVGRAAAPRGFVTVFNYIGAV